MNINKFRSFAVIFSGSKELQGAVFRRTKAGYELFKSHSITFAEKDPPEVWKEIFRHLSISKDDPLLIAGLPEKGFFFRTEMAEIPVKAVRNALNMELPRRMILADTENMLISFTCLAKGTKKKPENENGEEFAQDNTDGQMSVNAFCFPAASLDSITENLVKCGRKADAFLYPFLSLQKDDPALYLADTEEKYYFAAGSWHVAAPEGNREDPAGTQEEWEKIFQKTFILPENFEIKRYASLLLCARFAITDQFEKSETGLNVLPVKLRPSRLKSQLKLCAVLIILILANMTWHYSGKWIANASEYRELAAEKASLQEENRKLRIKIRRIEKEGKEKFRSGTLKLGEHDIVGKLNDLTRHLPSNVMISWMRWNDSGLDLTMFSEANSGISEIFRTKFPYWKLANIQQRNFGGAATMITVKLTNAEKNSEPDPEGRRK